MAEFFAKWRSGLAKTSKTAFGRLATLFGATEITQDTWDELETVLIQADLGIETVTDILDALHRLVRTEGLTRSDELSDSLRAELRARLETPPPFHWTERPSVIMVVGVNGSGKTTTIAKLAQRFQREGKSLLFGEDQHLGPGLMRCFLRQKRLILNKSAFA